MNDAVKKMLDQRSAATREETKNALKEIIQEIVLLSLSRAKFFEHAAFYGGTALRLFYGLDRFSEDLDFSLLRPDPSFSLERYCTFVKDELQLYGFNATVKRKKKRQKSRVDSAFVKANTLWHLIHITAIEHPEIGTHRNELLKVKFEVDTDPPHGAEYEARFLYQPLPFSVKLFDPPSLYAGKMHAFLFRNLHGVRVKGRDVYDIIWLAAQDIPISKTYLENILRQSGNISGDQKVTDKFLQNLIKNRFISLDLEAARNDVQSFLVDPRAIEVWSPEFFQDVTKRIRLM